MKTDMKMFHKNTFVFYFLVWSTSKTAQFLCAVDDDDESMGFVHYFYHYHELWWIYTGNYNIFQRKIEKGTLLE